MLLLTFFHLLFISPYCLLHKKPWIYTVVGWYQWGPAESHVYWCVIYKGGMANLAALNSDRLVIYGKLFLHLPYISERIVHQIFCPPD